MRGRGDSTGESMGRDISLPIIADMMMHCGSEATSKAGKKLKKCCGTNNHEEHEWKMELSLISIIAKIKNNAKISLDSMVQDTFNYLM